MPTAHLLTLLGFLMAAQLAAAPLIVAHRGASHDAPENTLPAFKLAWDQGADAIEGDFRLTKDGAIVCLHDADTARVADQKLVVQEATLAELRALDIGRWRGAKWAGTRIPTLAEVLATVPAGKRIYLEVKGGPAMVAPLLAEVTKSGLAPAQVVIIAFDAAVIRAAKAAEPAVAAYWLTGFKRDPAGALTPTLEAVLATLKDCGADGLNADGQTVPEAVARGVQAAAYSFHVWTVDDAPTARRLAAWGAASLTTNRPAPLRRALPAK